MDSDRWTPIASESSLCSRHYQDVLELGRGRSHDQTVRCHRPHRDPLQDQAAPAGRRLHSQQDGELMTTVLLAPKIRWTLVSRAICIKGPSSVIGVHRWRCSMLRSGAVAAGASVLRPAHSGRCCAQSCGRRCVGVPTGPQWAFRPV